MPATAPQYRTDSSNKGKALSVFRTNPLIITFLILGIFTTSFDIFLVFNLGFNFRMSQIFLLVPIGYVFLTISAAPVVRWPLGFSPLLIWALFMAAFIPNTGHLTRSIGYWLWLAFDIILIFAVVQLLDNVQKILTVIRWYLYSFLFVATFGIFQFFAPTIGLEAPLVQQWWFKGILPRVNGFSYEPSYFASYLVMGWVLSLHLLKYRTSLFCRKKLWIIAAVITLALLLSSSRAGILAMIIWLAQYPALLLWRLSRGSLNKTLLAISAALTLVILLIAIVVSMIGVTKLEFLLAGVGLLGQAAHSISARTQALQDTLEIFFQSPIIGYSLGGISSAIGHLQGIDVTSLEIAKQNEGMAIFAEALAASGIIGVIPFGIYIFRIVRSPLQLAPKTLDRTLQTTLSGLTYALIIELIILQFNQNILRLYLWMHIAILSAFYSVGMRNNLALAFATFARQPARQKDITIRLKPETPEDHVSETCLV